MKIYLSSDALKIAAYIVAYYTRETAAQMVSYKIRQLAEDVTPENAANLAFWAQVYARMADLKLPADEVVRLRTDIPESARQGLAELQIDSVLYGAA